MKDKGERREQLVVFRQMLANERIAFRLDLFVEGGCPFDENLLRGIVEREVRELDAGPNRPCSPFGRIESGKPVEDVIDPLPRVIVGDAIAIFPRDRVGIDEELKALQEPVIAERV